MRYLLNPSTDPHFNMAFDQFCLERLQADEPVFFLWQNRPSVIIGLNQSAYAEVNLRYLEEQGIVLARRVTGGGAVYHDLQNLNYSIVGRSADLERDYPGYLTYVIEALRALGVPAELSGRNDILVEGRKDGPREVRGVDQVDIVRSLPDQPAVYALECLRADLPTEIPVGYLRVLAEHAFEAAAGKENGARPASAGYDGFFVEVERGARDHGVFSHAAGAVSGLVPQCAAAPGTVGTDKAHALVSRETVHVGRLCPGTSSAPL